MQFPLLAATGHDRLSARLALPLQPISARRWQRPRLRRQGNHSGGPVVLRAASQLAASQDTAARHFRVQGRTRETDRDDSRRLTSLNS